MGGSMEKKKLKVKVVVTVKLTVTGFFEKFGLSRGLDAVSDLFGKALLLELVSADLDPRAFFDMYVGDVPVSEQTKEEIGRNVANMMRRC